MKYGTSVYGDQWNSLMETARERAAITGQRTKIVASINGVRAARILGSKYTYTIMLADQPYNRRCGEEGPNGKPCISNQGTCGIKTDAGGRHVSRGFDRGTYLVWSYQDYYGKPVDRRTNSMQGQTFTEDELNKMGYYPHD